MSGQKIVTRPDPNDPTDPVGSSEATRCLMKTVIEKVTAIVKAEAGCQQSNYKYNLAKNDLSHRMELPMIKARMSRIRRSTNVPF